MKFEKKVKHISLMNYSIPKPYPVYADFSSSFENEPSQKHAHEISHASSPGLNIDVLETVQFRIGVGDSRAKV